MPLNSNKSNSQKTEQSISGLNNGQNYATLTKEQLMAVCIDKDAIIESCVKSLKAQCPKMLGKKEIMDVYHCESDKALRILKLKRVLCVQESAGRFLEKYGRQRGLYITFESVWNWCNYHE